MTPNAHLIAPNETHASPLLKTDMLAWGATVMNIAGEMAVSPHVSVSLPLMWCPWFLSEKFAVRAFAFQPEARWWRSKLFRSHALGIHFSCAWFNVRFGNFRYQDCNTPLLGAGLSYIYALPLTKNFVIEFEIGAGVSHMKYQRYYNIPNGKLIDIRKTTYWGIDRAAVSLCYELPL